MSVSEIEESDLVTSASLEEKAKLKRHFSRFDIYFFLICTIVGVDTLAQVTPGGNANAGEDMEAIHAEQVEITMASARRLAEKVG